MIEKIKPSTSEKIIFSFILILGLLCLTTFFLLKNKCSFIKNYDPERINLRNYLTQTLQRFYQHIILPDNIAFMRMFTEQSQKDIQLAQYFYDKCALNIQDTIAFALEYAHAKNEINCLQPKFSAMMYFGILRGVEWRNLMGLDVPENDVDYKFWFKVENLKLLPGSYSVEVSSKNISRFSNSNVDIEYFIALEPESSYAA